MSKVIGYIITGVITVALSLPRSPKPIPGPAADITPTYAATPTLAVTVEIAEPVSETSRNCNPDTGWWDKPVTPDYAIAVILDHERGGYDYCPPPGSAWEEWLTVPGYFLTHVPPPTPTGAPYTPLPNPLPVTVTPPTPTATAGPP